jgi:hypothetical protein
LPQAGGRPPESEPRSFKVTYLYRAEGSGEPLPIRHGEVLNSNNLYKIVIKPDRDCFVYIFQLDSAGKVFQLFPMRTREQNIFNVNPVKMNQLYMLPSQDKSFKLDEQAGVEKIYLFVTERADPRLENLMFELDKHKAQRGSESMDAFLKDNAMNFKSRGLERIADDEPVQVSWKGSESLYTAMQHRLDGVSKSCMNVLEFRHVKVGESSD